MVAAPGTTVSENEGSTTTADGTPNTAARQADEAMWITSAPRLAIVGQQVALSGQGFLPTEKVTLSLVDAAIRQPVAGAQATADVRGAIPTTALVLPAGLNPGEYALVARGETSEKETSGTLWVRTTPPALELSHEALRPEERLSITATGFAPRERVVIYFEGQGEEPLTAGQADQDGTARAQNVAIPVMAAGERQLVAIGSESRGQARHAFRIMQFDPVVTVNANIVPPGETIGVFGSGFAARDTVQATLEGSDEAPASLRTNDGGQLVAPQTIKLPANLEGQQSITLRATRTDRTIHVSFRTVRSFPFIELGSYFGKAGSEVTIAARYLRPQERFEVFLGEGGQRKKLATFRADDNGWLKRDSVFQIPPDTPAGAVTLSFEGEASRQPIRATFTVLR